PLPPPTPPRFPYTTLFRSQRRVLGPDRRQVDRDPLLDGRDGELERLARAVGEGQLDRLAVELHALALERLPDDRDVLARALQLLDRKSTRLNSSHEWISYA